MNVKLNAFNIYGLYFLDCVLGIGYFILGLHYLKVYKILKKGEETKDNSILEMKNLSLTTKFWIVFVVKIIFQKDNIVYL